MSSSGQSQTAAIYSGTIYYNSNYGQGTWTPITFTGVRQWWGLAMSSSGQYQTACDGTSSNFIYINKSYGEGSWTAITLPSSYQVFSIAMSSSGQYQTAVTNGTPILINNSYGEGTWTAVTDPAGGVWSSVAMSSSGQYQTAVTNGLLEGTIYYNSNYGQGKWTRISSPTEKLIWQSVAMSSSGQNQVAVARFGHIYINNNYGQGSWTPITEQISQWCSVAMSSSGQYISAANEFQTNYLYVTPFPNNSNLVNLSATGSTGPTGGTNLYVNASIVPTTGFQYSLGFSGPDSSYNSLLWDNVYANNVIAKRAVFANNIQLTSDYRIKNNVKQLDDTFTVKYLKPISYTNKQTNTNDIGLIAHELQEQYPELVTGNKDGPELQTINYNGLIPILINKIKSIRNRIEILEEEEDDEEENEKEENKKVEDILSNDNELKK
jgi:hypothetical protein